MVIVYIILEGNSLHSHLLAACGIVFVSNTCSKINIVLQFFKLISSCFEAHFSLVVYNLGTITKVTFLVTGNMAAEIVLPPVPLFSQVLFINNVSSFLLHKHNESQVSFLYTTVLKSIH